MDGLFQFEDGCVRLSFARMNAPCGLRVVVDGVSNRPAVLLKIGRRAAESYRLWFGRAGSEDFEFDFVEMQVAIFSAAGTIGGQRFVRQDVEADGSDLRQTVGVDGEDGRVSFGVCSGGQQGAVFKAVQLSVAGGREGQQCGGFPCGSRLLLLEPCGDE